MGSRKELRDAALDTTRQKNVQIGPLVNDFINFTLSEINFPAWALKKGSHYLWNFLKRKTTFTTGDGDEDYVMKRDVDKIAFLRQTESPTKLIQIPDEKFFKLVPNPTAEGDPLYYRVWEREGVSTRLAADDTIDVISSSTSDSGNSALTVSVSGYDTDNVWRTETYQLNGTTVVPGSITFDADREIVVSKQQDTTGKITIRRNTGPATLVILGPDERTARFKVLSLYPIPNSSITMYLEYYRPIPLLNNDSDAPIFHENWHYVVRLGTIAKIYQYLNKPDSFQMHALFRQAVRGMVEWDRSNPDLIEIMDREIRQPGRILSRSQDEITA